MEESRVKRFLIESMRILIKTTIISLIIKHMTYIRISVSMRVKWFHLRILTLIQFQNKEDLTVVMFKAMVVWRIIKDMLKNSAIMNMIRSIQRMKFKILCQMKKLIRSLQSQIRWAQVKKIEMNKVMNCERIANNNIQMSFTMQMTIYQTSINHFQKIHIRMNQIILNTVKESNQVNN